MQGLSFLMLESEKEMILLPRSIPPSPNSGCHQTGRNTVDALSLSELVIGSQSAFPSILQNHFFGDSRSIKKGKHGVLGSTEEGRVALSK